IPVSVTVRSKLHPLIGNQWAFKQIISIPELILSCTPVASRTSSCFDLSRRRWPSDQSWSADQLLQRVSVAGSPCRVWAAGYWSVSRRGRAEDGHRHHGSHGCRTGEEILAFRCAR